MIGESVHNRIFWRIRAEGGNKMKKILTKCFGFLTLALALGIALTPAGFNNMVINTVAK